ncbi:unnamed protein product [Rhizophagus irregularis]|nr:unnamed protein product [Rhizophagus irregularis]
MLVTLRLDSNKSIRFYYTPLIEDDDKNEEGIEDDDDELEDDNEESDDEDEGESESDEEEEDEQCIRPNVTTRQQSQHQQHQQQSQHQQHQQQPQRQHHQQQPNTASIINRVQKEIYGVLFDYWNDPPMAILLATILDPRCKRTHDDDDELEDDDEESNDEDEGESESDEEEEDEQHIRPNVTTRQQSQHQQHQQQPQRQHYQQQPNTASIINRIQKEIYGALFDYWNDPPMAMLLATILDSRCKRTHGWPNELQERVKVELKVQYDEIKPQNNIQPEENFSNNNSSIDCFHTYIFGPQVIEENEDTEFDNYFRTPQASYDTNPF